VDGSGLSSQRLYGIGPQQVAWSVDLDPAGRPLGPVLNRPQLGQVRAVAGSPTRAAFAYVAASGQRVVYQSEGAPRTLLTGEFLHLDAAAFSPDGEHLAVDRGTSALRELLVLEVATARLRATLPYAGRFAWSPSSAALVLEVARSVEPQLPWEDGGTRDLSLVDLEGRELRRLAKGDSKTVFGLEGWETPDAVWALQTRYAVHGDDVVEVAAQRLMIDPATGRRTPGAGRSRLDTETAQLAKQFRFAPGTFEVAAANHPRFILFRRAARAGAELYLVGRDLAGEPLRLCRVPPLDEALDVSWGALPR